MHRAATLRPRLIRLAKVVFSALVAAALLCLPFVGWFLSRADPLQRADVIVVLAGARVDRWLEAVDLYKEGWAPRMLLSPGPVSALEERLRSQGLKLPREGDTARDAVISLGVPANAVEVMPGGVDNTAAEAATLRGMLPAGSVHRVIVVTSTYHVRRAGFAFKRELEGTGIEVVARGSRYTEARPARWWTRREDIRFLMNEVPKYLVYLLGLGA
jgi:uncharacterized SAM-binding protein YcdF (DUF218 family)